MSLTALLVIKRNEDMVCYVTVRSVCH